MVDIKTAEQIVKKAIPDGAIQAYIEYKGLYVFQVFTTDPGEEELDPFYSVNQKTGEFRDFSVLTDGNMRDISRLFYEAKTRKKR